MDAYLQTTDVIDWQHPDVLALAHQLAISCLQSTDTPVNRQWAIAKACFEWVRDEIYHSVDYQMNPVTWKASDVLQYRTGYCYAKSHLLAALLRANGIPAGFCYQRLSIDDQGPPYCLHGLNAIYLADDLTHETRETGAAIASEIAWYRVDPRGNRPGINAQFTPPVEQLAYQPQLPGEIDGQTIFPNPLPIVLVTLKTYQQWDQVLANLPDLDLYRTACGDVDIT